MVCSGPITYDNTQVLRDIDNFQTALEDVKVEEAFMPVVAPASFLREAHNEYYPTEEAYVFAIADALRQEYHAILDAGFLLQVDDAVLATMWAVMESEGPAGVSSLGGAAHRSAQPRARRAFRRTACATTCAGAAGLVRT